MEVRLMIRELAKSLTAFTDFKAFVIIETTFRRGNFQSGAQIVKAHSAMAIIRTSTEEAELEVKMIRPRREIQAAYGCRVHSEKIWRVFTETEVSNFTASVGDANPVHKLNPPIVPGLLILETLCEIFKPASVKLRFKNFITAGEPLSLHVDGGCLEISSAGVRKVSGEFL